MLGNDVIDLEAAALESNPLRRGWREKIFTKGERGYIDRASDRIISIWELWAAKESAYKAHARLFGETGFFPLRIVCSPETGTVQIGHESYRYHLHHRGGKVSAFAVAGPISFADIIPVEAESLIIRDGLPFVQSAAGWKPASRSHHGRYAEAVTIADSAWISISGTQDRSRMIRQKRQ